MKDKWLDARKPHTQAKIESQLPDVRRLAQEVLDILNERAQFRDLTSREFAILKEAGQYKTKTFHNPTEVKRAKEKLDDLLTELRGNVMSNVDPQVASFDALKPEPAGMLK